MTTNTPETIPLPRIHSTYAGGIVMGVMAGENEAPDYLLLDLGVEPDKDVNWKEALDWAKSVGGELPTRREQAQLFSNRRNGQYQSRWYWSCEAHADEPTWAWYQGFYDGHQYGSHEASHGRARAVRRVLFR